MKYCVIDNMRGNEVIVSFGNKRECREWLMEGMYGCEGAERDHYVSMLQQLDHGKRTLEYWD